MVYSGSAIRKNLNMADVVIHEIGNMMMGLDFSFRKLTENTPEIINNKYYLDIKEDIGNMMKMIVTSKANHKNEEINKENINLDKIICKVLEKYDEVCKNNNIKLIYTTHRQYSKRNEYVYLEENSLQNNNRNKNEEFIFFGDANKIRRVLDNFIKNAIEELCHEENSALTNKHIDIVMAREENSHIIIEINNNGRVIEEEYLKKLFNPVCSSKADGMGIGLSICQEIVNMHSGKIKAASDVESGTTFTIYLPIDE